MATLRRVSAEEELVALRDRMTQYLPYSAGIHGFIDVMLKCQVQEILDLKVFVPDTLQPSSLVVVTPSCSQPNIQSATVFWDTEKEEDQDVARMLRTLPRWDWSAPVYFKFSPVAVYNKFQQYMKDGTLATGQMWSYEVLDGHLFSMDSTKVPRFRIPEGYSIDSLRPKDIPTIISQWTRRWNETSEGLESLVTKLPSAAIRSHLPKDGDGPASEETGSVLVSWGFLYHIGSLGSIFTLPEHRRRGLGTALTLTMAERLRQKDLPVRSVVDGSNSASISYHRKLGFEQQCDVKIFVMLPIGKTIEDYC
ncbi:uncharacterized protein LOC122246717 [Penaeus japonicus]|uniref:uncharacterized protein LOC122246717 n=1 Tax=Penaeus japonicus TaxID=27405 RepID=UPI001C7125A8|nr:uncharacterized protein LOC122246717 [Penaeus japonicus]